MSIEAFLAEYQQTHLEKTVKSLDEIEQQQLFKQIQSFRSELTFSPLIEKKKTGFSPVKKLDKPTLKDIEDGKELIRNGKAASVLLAGGLGTRLGIDGPKGCYPITNVEKKTLFQLYCEKLKAQQEQLNCRLLAAVMVSSFNHKETIEFFERHQYWGLSRGQVLFFEQENTPYLDNEGKWFWSKKNSIAHSPNGNGYVFHCMEASKTLMLLQKAGVKYLQVSPIDNPLSYPLDPGMLGYHKREASDVVLGAVERQHPQEMLGLIVDEDGKTKIAEYSEISDVFFQELNEKKKLKYRYGNSGIHSFCMNFVEKIVSESSQPLPVHWVKKKTRQWTGSFFEDIWAWKVEHFIFDWLNYCTNVKAVKFDRTLHYAPLKRQQGSGGVLEVQEALLNKDRKILCDITKQDTEHLFFELSPSFYYPTEKILQEWRNKRIPNSNYIFPEMSR